MLLGGVIASVVAQKGSAGFPTSLLTRAANMPRPSPSNSYLPQHHVRFLTEEGTWMSVDVSPIDGTIVFDLLGDLYVLKPGISIARQLTGPGSAVNRFPRFSPDGQLLAYVSDASGTDQIWVMRPDGTGKRRLSSFNQFNSPAWPPITPAPTWVDGQTVLSPGIADSTVGYYALSLVGGNQRLVAAAGNCRMPGEAAISPTGEVLVICGSNRKDVAGVAHFSAFASGGKQLQLVTSDRPLSMRISPDGRWLIYILLEAASSDLKPASLEIWRRNRSLGSASDTKIAAIKQDPQGAYSSIKVPRFGFTPNSRALVTSSGGHIVNIDIHSGQMLQRVFQAEIARPVSPVVRKPRRIEPKRIPVRQMLDPEMAPDGSALAFSAAGKIWIARRHGTLVRLSNRSITNNTIEHGPAVAPDGRSVAYASWSPSAGGSIWLASLRSQTSKRLTASLGDLNAFGALHWSPDGSALFALAGHVSAATQNGLGPVRSSPVLRIKPSLVKIDIRRGRTEAFPLETDLLMSDSGSYSRDLSYVQRTGRLYFWRHRNVDEDAVSELVSRSFTGDSRERVEVRIRNGERVRGTISPDGQWLALEHNADIYLAWLPSQPAMLEIDMHCYDRANMSACQRKRQSIVRVTYSGGLAPTWSADSRHIRWHWRTEAFDFQIYGQRSNRGNRPHRRFKIDLNIDREFAPPLLLRGATIITMADRTIADGEILIVDGRIVTVAKAGTTSLPPGTRVVNVPGKYIVPGFISIQDTEFESSVLTPFSDLFHRAGLDSGITTIWAPGWGDEYRLSREETRLAGAYVGRRNLSPGCNPIQFPRDGLESFESVSRAVYRCAAQDNFQGMIEVYHRTVRLQRRWAARAARSMGVAISSEGQDFHYRIGELIDGFTLLEHNKTPMLYDDVKQFWAQTGVSWNSDAQPSLSYLLELQRHGMTIGVSEENSQPQVDAVSAVVRLSPHSSNGEAIEALKLLTTGPARVLDVERDLGSLEPGKIGDFVVLDFDPRTALSNLECVSSVYQSGRLVSKGRKCVRRQGSESARQK